MNDLSTIRISFRKVSTTKKNIMNDASEIGIFLRNSSLAKELIMNGPFIPPTPLLVSTRHVKVD